MSKVAYNVAFAIVIVGLATWISRSAGLSWPWTAVLSTMVLVASWKLLGVQIGGTKRNRYDLERFIQESLLILSENSAWLEVKHRASPLTFRIIRASGNDSAAEVILAVPRAAWSESKLNDLVRMFEMHDVSFVTDEAKFAHAPSLIETRFVVANIWIKAAGAKPARVAHLILDTFGVGAGELLDLRLEGTPSARWKLHREELFNLRG